MREHAKIKHKYFFLSFSITFFVLSLIFLFMMSITNPKTPESLIREPETDGAATTYVPKESDALSVLFIGVEREESSAETFILAKFDPARGKVPAVTFPPQTAIQNSGKTENLAEIYRYGGAEYTKDTLAEALNIPIDRYVRIRLNNFIVCAAAIGTVEYNLDKEVTIARGGAPVTLGKGKQLLDGQKVADIISYADYPGGELERCAITSDLTAAIINQRMDICRSTVFESVFEKIINLIDTDISYQDYNNRKHAAEFMARVGEAPAQALTLSGEWSEDRQLYTLSDTFLASLTQDMR